MRLLDQSAIEAAVTFDQVMDTLEQAFALMERGDYRMPERISVIEGEDTVLYMPCFAGEYFGTKLLTLFPGNQAKGYPYIHGVYVLHRRETGEIVALLDGSFLTALRTGAAGGVGMRHFAAPQSRAVGIVGCGTQGFYQALYACKTRPIDTVWLFDPFVPDLAPYAARLSARLGEGVTVRVCATAEKLLEASDIVVTTTTSMTPVLPDDPTLLGGKLFVAVGSYKPHMRELPPAIWQVTDHVITELPYACEESGDLSQPIAQGVLRPEDVGYTGKLIFGGDKPTPQGGRSVIYKSVGIGLFDLMTARLVYEKTGG